MKPRARIPCVNPKRRKLRQLENFGPKASWIRQQPCCMRLHGGCTSKIEAHHVRSRGAGGKAESLVPLCSFHHSQLHLMGKQSFENFHVKDLSRTAERYEKAWQESL